MTASPTQVSKLKSKYIEDIRARNSGNRNVSIYSYNRTALEPGIIVIGISPFPRSLLVDSIDRGLETRVPGFENYGVVAVSLHSPDRTRSLKNQDGLSALLEKSGEGTKVRVVGSIIDTIDVTDAPYALTKQIGHKNTQIIAITVTPQTYERYLTADGKLNLGNEDIRHDLQFPLATPRSFVGHIVRGIAYREEKGMGGLTLLSLDNMQGNGDRLRTLIEEFMRTGRLDPNNQPIPDDKNGYARLLPAFANYTTPNSMGDRITPKPTGADLRSIGTIGGFTALEVTPTEPRPTQGVWVIERDPRLPKLEDAGLALIVPEAAPYETLRRHTLDALQVVVANTGDLVGYRFIHEIMADPLFERASRTLLQQETGPTIPNVPGIDILSYQDEVVRRLKNVGLEETTKRVADETPLNTILTTVHDQLCLGGPTEILALGVAAWIRRIGVDRDEKGQTLNARHPNKFQLRQAYQTMVDHDPTPLFAMTDLFGTIGESKAFTQQVRSYLRRLDGEGGVRSALSHAVLESGSQMNRIQGGVRPIAEVQASGLARGANPQHVPGEQ